MATHPAPPPKIPSAKIRWKISPLNFFWGDQEGILLIVYLPKGQNYQRGVLLISAGAIEGYFEGKTPTQKKLAYMDFQCLDHPPYSPDLAPSDYHLFPELKKQMKCHFSSDADADAECASMFRYTYISYHVF